MKITKEKQVTISIGGEDRGNCNGCNFEAELFAGSKGVQSYCSLYDMEEKPRGKRCYDCIEHFGLGAKQEDK